MILNKLSSNINFDGIYSIINKLFYNNSEISVSAYLNSDPVLERVNGFIEMIYH